MPKLLTTVEAAEILRLHPVTLRRKAAAGMVPCLRISGRFRFYESRLMAWLDAGCPSPQEQPSLFDQQAAPNE